jgi:ABC-2 type transport system ATP-binding protein
MKKIVLATRRPWNWKVFLVLIGLVILAAFAIVPFSVHQLKAYGEGGANLPGWEVLVMNAMINGLINSILGGIGLLIASRIGLGLPFVEGRVKGEQVPARFRTVVAIAWIAGVGIAIGYLILQSWVFSPPMQALFEEIGYIVPEEAITPPLYGLLAAFSAGVTEETVFRLFGLSLLAWVGGLLFQDSEGRPKLAVLWIANILFALAFGAAHLPAAESMGWPITPLIVVRTVVLSAVGGLVLGWLFWTFGLETAMLAHFFGDVVLYTLLPIIVLQQSEGARYAALAAVGTMVVLTFGWAWRTLVVESRRLHLPTEGAKPEHKPTPPNPMFSKNGSNLAICTHDLTKDFDTVRALNTLSLEIPAGTIFGFLGPNGAGKTTTIRLLLGLLEPTWGNAQVLGFDPQTQADQIRTLSGALLEHSGIYEQMSAEDNLEFYGRAFRMPEAARKARIQELLNEMGLWERRNDRVGTWSRGMKQKLALARTMLHRPKLILLDEPTAGLDVPSAVSVREDLACLASRENVTIFLTTHNMVDAEKLCHQVGIICEGKLLAVDSPEALSQRASSQRVEIRGRNFCQQTLQMLRTHPKIEAIVTENDRLVVNLRPETDVATVVSVLVGTGAQVEEVYRNKASLEEVFLSLTGEQNA